MTGEKSSGRLNQRDRLLAEMAYLEDLRSIRRRREMVPHRVQLDLFLGGKRVGCEERFDIKREIQRLKAMAMPTRARDLFHGKGIQLPPTHMSLLPRPSRGPEDSDSDDDAPGTVHRTMDQSFNILDLQSPSYERRISLTIGEIPTSRSMVRGKRHQQLPGISKSQTPRAGLARDDSTHSQASVPPTGRSAAWVEEQNQLLSRSQEGTPVSTSSRTGARLELEVHLPPGARVDNADSTLDSEDVVKATAESRKLSSRTGRAKTAGEDKEEVATTRHPLPQHRGEDGQTSESSAGLVHPVQDSHGDRSSTLVQGAPGAAKPGPVEPGLSQARGRPQQQVQIKDDRAHRAGSSSLEEGRQASPPVSHTPNPLKAGLLLNVSQEQESSLRETFERLDTDMDGHLQYHQLKSQLPEEFSKQQEWFVRQVYEITSTSAAFFGVDEFLMMTQLTNRVASLTGQAQEAYGKIDFETLETCIIKYVDLFQRADSSQKGRISAEALRSLLGESQNKAGPDENSPCWNAILDSLSLDYASNINRIEYLAHIPLFMVLVPPTIPNPPPLSQLQGSSADGEEEY